MTSVDNSARCRFRATAAPLVLDIEKARVARAALDGRPPPRLLRPALVPLPVALNVDDLARSAAASAPRTRRSGTLRGRLAPGNNFRSRVRIRKHAS